VRAVLLDVVRRRRPVERAGDGGLQGRLAAIELPDRELSLVAPAVALGVVPPGGRPRWQRTLALELGDAVHAVEQRQLLVEHPAAGEPVAVEACTVTESVLSIPYGGCDIA
jgi:hypothetical protein